MRLHVIFTAAALATAVPVAADAMPVAQPIPLAGSEAPAVTLTSGGCGIGFHRTYWGGCRPNWGWGGGYGWGGYGWGWRHRWGGYGWGGWHRGWHGGWHGGWGGWHRGWGGWHGGWHRR